MKVAAAGGAGAATLADGDVNDRNDSDPGAASGRDRRRRCRGRPARDSAVHTPRVDRRPSRPDPRPSEDRNRPGVRAVGGAAAHYLLVGGLDELARVSLQSAPDHAACGWLRAVHDRRCRRRDASPAVHAVADRLPAGRHHIAARPGGAAVDRPPAEPSEAYSCHPRRRRTGERRDRADPLPLRGRGGEHGGIFPRARDGDVQRDRRRRTRLGDRGRLADAAPQALG